MAKLDAGLMTSLPASDPGSTTVSGSKRINPRPQSCLCLAWSGCPSNDDKQRRQTEVDISRRLETRFSKSRCPNPKVSSRSRCWTTVSQYSDVGKAHRCCKYVMILVKIDYLYVLSSIWASRCFLKLHLSL